MAWSRRLLPRSPAIRWLFVIARNSSFTYKGQAIDVKQVGRELGVRYVLEGSVRKAAGRVRITVQLIDTLTGTHLWADRFDGSLEDVFDLQDKVATSVAGVIEPELQAAEIARSANRPTNDLTAYDLYLRAYAMFWSSAKQNPEALRLTEQAIARDPRYGPALAWAAYCCMGLLHANQSKDRIADTLRGADLARRALEVAADDPAVLAYTALVLAYFGEDIRAMTALVERALVLNPSFARGWFISSVLKLWAGQPDLAIKDSEASLRLSPRERTGTTLCVIGGAHFFARRFDEAVPETGARGPGRPKLPSTVSLSRRLLRAYGPARRRQRDCCAAAHHHPCLDPGRQLPAQIRAPRAVAVGLAPGGGRQRLNTAPRDARRMPA
jgi:adenylate cyclase